MYVCWLGPLSIIIAILLTEFFFRRSPITDVPLVLSPLLLILYYVCLRRAVVCKENEKIARNVAAVNPGLDIAKWDQVARKVNCDLYEDGSWKTPYFY